MSTTYDKKCTASVSLKTGCDDGPWYKTLMPFEHFNSIRTQQFPDSCDVQQLAGVDNVTVSARSSSATFPSPYNVVTRERDELFVYGGYVNQGNGAYVAKLDPATLTEKWRVNLKVADNEFFDWPGVAGVLGNGFVYAIAGNLLAKIDPETGVHSIVHLPEHAGGGGAAYNGFVVSNQRVLIAKSIERGTTAVNSLAGLRAASTSGIPAFLIAVDPEDLRILAQIETPEPILGRVMIAQHGDQEYVYLAGSSRVWRYCYTGSDFLLDQDWNPVYANAVAGEEPGTACGMLHDWVIIQTNFLRSSQPLRISAFHVSDSHRSHTIIPFPQGVPSQEFSKPAIDPATMRIYTSDQAAGLVTGINFNPATGFSVAWQDAQNMASFWAIVGPVHNRNIIGTNHTLQGDHVLWRAADDGHILASSAVLDPKFNGNIVSTGFNGRFYYLAEEGSKVVELTLACIDQN